MNTMNDVYKLSDIMESISRNVNDLFPFPIWITAEVSSISKPAARGHYYLELVETDASGNEICKNKASIWASKAASILEKFKTNTGSELKSGLKIQVKCRISFHKQYQLSISIEDINPEFTLGGMEAKMKQIMARLDKENISHLNKQIRAPFDFSRIAVISPAEAAGLGDFKKDAEILDQSNICRFDYYQAIFQGKDTNNSVTQAIKSVINSDILYDAIILIRGGGSKTDLHFLNEYDIAKEICLSKIPFFVGVGHERDKGVLDYVANISFDTPSKVIGHIFSVIVNNSNLMKNKIALINTMASKSLNQYKSTIEKIKLNIFNQSRLKITRSKNMVENKYTSIKNKSRSQVQEFKTTVLNKNKTIKLRATNKIEIIRTDTLTKKKTILSKSIQVLELKRSQVTAINKLIQTYRPENISKLGFIIAMKDGKIVTESSNLEAGDMLEIIFKDSRIKVKVIGGE